MKNNIFECHLYGLCMEGRKIGNTYLVDVEQIPSELVDISEDPPELFYRPDTDQTLAARI